MFNKNTKCLKHLLNFLEQNKDSKNNNQIEIEYILGHASKSVVKPFKLEIQEQKNEKYKQLKREAEYTEAPKKIKPPYSFTTTKQVIDNINPLTANYVYEKYFINPNSDCNDSSEVPEWNMKYNNNTVLAVKEFITKHNFKHDSVNILKSLMNDIDYLNAGAYVGDFIKPVNPDYVNYVLKQLIIK